METYTLDPAPLAGSEEITGTLDYALRRKDRPDTVICYLRVPPEEAVFLTKLFNSQAEKAWQEGHDHYGKYFSPNFAEFGVNPYTVKEEDQ
jgi:hypothetical protein